MTSPRITLLYNEPVLPRDHPDFQSEFEILETMDAVDQILRSVGFEVARLGVRSDLRELFDVLTDDPPDAVFNMFEGFADRPFTESVVAGVLEWLDIPFTGSPADTLALARDKQRAKLLFKGAGLPTAPFFVVDTPSIPKNDLGWPAFVKPAAQDASVGVDQESVVTNQSELEARVQYVLSRYGPALVEKYIAGREFHVHVIEGAPDEHGRYTPLVLPLAEVVFQREGVWPIYDYTAKWAEQSDAYRLSPLVAPVIVPPMWHKRIIDVCRGAYRLLGCRDYARVDLRVTPGGEPFILEVNPNPFLDSIAIVNGLDAVGRNHTQFVADLARAALERRNPPDRPRGGAARPKCLETA